LAEGGRPRRRVLVPDGCPQPPMRVGGRVGGKLYKASFLARKPVDSRRTDVARGVGDNLNTVQSHAKTPQGSS
jgi:hypothetical protein